MQNIPARLYLYLVYLYIYMYVEHAHTLHSNAMLKCADYRKYYIYIYIYLATSWNAIGVIVCSTLYQIQNVLENI